MPIYDFECDGCGNKEKDVRVQRRDLDEPLNCTQCGKEMRKEFPLPGRPQVGGGTPIHHG